MQCPAWCTNSTNAFDRVAWWSAIPIPMCLGVSFLRLDMAYTMSWEMLSAIRLVFLFSSFSSSSPFRSRQMRVYRLWGTTFAASSLLARVDSIKALGVVVNNRFTAADHVDSAIAACAKSLYALKVLRSHGMPTSALCTVFQALTYCSSAWYGFCAAKDRDKLESFLRRCKHSGYCADNTPTIKELCAASDAQLFQRVIANPQHTLHLLLPSESTITYDLRQRAHNFTLPDWDKHCALDNCNFITRMLYANCYWHYTLFYSSLLSYLQLRFVICIINEELSWVELTDPQFWSPGHSSY